MQRGKINVFRVLLIKQLRELQMAAGKTFHALQRDELQEPDPLDRAVKECDRSVELVIRNRDRHLIREIYEALKRLEQSSYGICESCGEPIGEKRLQAKPTTRCCVQCQAMEERERRAMLYALAGVHF